MRNNNFMESINFKPWWIAALSPFIYAGMGLWFGWWTQPWAWIIIPVTIIIAIGNAKKQMLPISMARGRTK